MITFNIQTLLLGVIQGLCEFLPVSSSGHLALAQIFFGLESEGLLAFDLILHCATMLAVLLFFWKDLGVLAMEWLAGWGSAEGRKREGWGYGWGILAASIVTALVAFPLKDLVERAMSSPVTVGYGLLVTAGLLFAVSMFPDGRKKLFMGAALFVGLAQGLAVFPGVSRSGATIVAGLFVGLGVQEAFRFSFLVSIPAIVGASLLEGRELLQNASLAVLPDGWLWAAFVAFLLGWVALLLLRRLVLAGRWRLFGVYCLTLGSLAVLLGNGVL
ncbi:MAG: undecaprenyl-diphosphate phosphatase [Fretibacterium sp.]|nr:undecaprenyl-diphosphate phosphatase [Fretibacterium sp.]